MSSRPASADGPSELDASDWLAVAKRVAARVKEDHILLLGAGVAFFALLAMFPAMIAAISIYGLISDPADVQRQITDLTGSLPSSTSTLLEEQLDAIASSSNSSLSLGLVIGLGAALFSASGGINQLIGALNVAYREDEARSTVAIRGLALGLTVGAIVFFGFAIGAIAVIPAIARGSSIASATETVVDIARWPLLLIGFMACLAMLYKVGPDRQAPRIRWASWGAVIATVIWALGSAIFSFYVSNFGSYNETYGSLAGVVILMLWLFLSSSIIIIGAVINAELELRTTADTTTGPRRPMGEREAEVADGVRR